MWLLIAFLFLLASIGFFLLALVSKIKDNGNAVKNLIRAILCLILFVVAMSFDEPPEQQDNQIDGSGLMDIQNRSLS